MKPLAVGDTVWTDLGTGKVKAFPKDGSGMILVRLDKHVKRRLQHLLEPSKLYRANVKQEPA